MGGNSNRAGNAPLTSLSTLCVIQGCLNPRQGSNLCAPHQQHTSELGVRRAMTQPDERQRQVEQMAKEVLLLSALASRVTEERDRLKRQLIELVPPGTTLRPALTDGSSAGYVSRTVGGIKAMVSDAKAFAAWVQKRYTLEVSLQVTVREAFTAKVLEMSEAAGVPIGPGGEVAEDAPAGIRVLNTPGSTRAVPDKANAAALWNEIRTGATILENFDHEKGLS
jgi:hypothetical protein